MVKMSQFGNSTVKLSKKNGGWVWSKLVPSAEGISLCMKQQQLKTTDHGSACNETGLLVYDADLEDAIP